MIVDHIMSRNIVTIGMDDSLEYAQALFDEHGFHHLLVVQRGRLVGIISDRDLLRNLSPFINNLAERTQDAATLKRRIHQVMTRSLVTVTRETPIADAAWELLESGVSCLPVIDDRSVPIGIVSWRDLLRAVVPPVPIMAESP
ncbi:MAG: CBS domain-containing protein [Planctomycetota bacterium]|nr:MAG: CBS domain-containing protein [Planctomycetota bacterium]